MAAIPVFSNSELIVSEIALSAYFLSGSCSGMQPEYPLPLGNTQTRILLPFPSLNSANTFKKYTILTQLPQFG
jgi:hypothetical protein